MHKSTQPTARIRAALSTFALGAIVAVMGCEKKEEVRSYSAPKDSGVAAAPAGSAQAAVKEVQWTVPAGWKELPPQPMRHAGFSISPDDPSAIFTVIPLPKSPLVENVNRWEGQVGLKPSGAEQVEKMIRHADLPGGHADIIDLTGPEPTDGKKRPRILGAMIERGPQIWFFKMTAPARHRRGAEGELRGVHGVRPLRRPGALRAGTIMAMATITIMITRPSLVPHPRVRPGRRLHRPRRSPLRLCPRRPPRRRPAGRRSWPSTTRPRRG
jgi:hypothetical protein